ncbi:TPA: hypothetical protein ACH3X1_008382 [Trebouxia sp. C0004]
MGQLLHCFCIGFRVYYNSFYSCRVAQLQLVSRSCAISSIQQLLQQQLFSSCTLAHRYTHAGNGAYVLCSQCSNSQLYNCSLSCELPSVHLPVVNTSVAKH